MRERRRKCKAAAMRSGKISGASGFLCYCFFCCFGNTSILGVKGMLFLELVVVVKAISDGDVVVVRETQQSTESLS